MQRRPGRRLYASQSFHEDEIQVLDEIFKCILRGGDAKVLARSPAARVVMKKCAVMKRSLELQKAKAADATHHVTSEYQVLVSCTCEVHHTAYEANPKGHAVDCPRWGTELPNDCLERREPGQPGSVG